MSLAEHEFDRRPRSLKLVSDCSWSSSLAGLGWDHCIGLCCGTVRGTLGATGGLGFGGYPYIMQ